MKRTTKPKHKKEFDPTRVMDKAERRKLLKYCSERAEMDLNKGRKVWITRNMLVYLALYSGLRVSELANLKCGDLWLKAAQPYILVLHSKRDKSRKVYIMAELVKMLKWYLRWKQQSAGESTREDAPLFASVRTYGHVPPITLMKSFHVALRESGVARDKLSIHSARHTYATYALAETGDLTFVKRQLGHSNIAMTDIYTNLTPEMNGEIVTKIDFEKFNK